jgi:hypothetical protein
MEILIQFDGCLYYYKFAFGNIIEKLFALRFVSQRENHY